MTSNIKIQSSNPAFCGRFLDSCSNMQQRALNAVPNFELKRSVNLIKTAGKKISSAEQRVILGATALITQPFIDAHNHNVDEKTRKVSVARTIAKIIVGTCTGFMIRKACIKGIDALSKIYNGKISKWKTIFTPEGITDNKTDSFEQYKNAMGTITALVVMLFTNFLIDAPLTKFLTNVFIDKQEGKK